MCCLESVNFFRNYVIFEDSALTFLPLLLYNEICICLRIPKSDRHNNITMRIGFFIAIRLYRINRIPSILRRCSSPVVTI